MNHGLLLPGAEPLGAPLPLDAAVDWLKVGSTCARIPACKQGHVAGLIFGGDNRGTHRRRPPDAQIFGV